MSDDQIIEPLEKKCPRCGGKSANPSNPSGRCSACLKKLAANKKKPGHWQRAQTKADDALRRQKGKNGTAHKKHSGLGSRASIVKQTQAAEKKTGQKLSPDRKNNAKGYAASNTRMVPEKLNRGRHHVDEKKLRNWKKRLKKSEIDTASLYTLLKAKAYELQDEALINLVKSLTPETLEQYIEMFDIEESLEKSAVPKLEPVAPATPSLANEVGKTHTVEVHPDIDHLYRAKGLIKENNRDYLHIGDFKGANFPSDIIKKIPRDANGMVTPEMIDKHIEGLPKKKVNITVQPYTWGSQQHRPGEQYALSVHMHPEEKMKMDHGQKSLWEHIKTDQHFPGGDDNKSGDQIGWSRVDAHSKPDHWHLDEIQSDFQHKDKIRDKSSVLGEHGDAVEAREADYTNWKAPDSDNWYDNHWYRNSLFSPDFNNEAVKKHPAFEKLAELEKEVHKFHGRDEREGALEALMSEAEKHGIVKPLSHYKELASKKHQKIRDDSNRLLDHLSHGHQDPQHMIHSAINALGRKLGIKSMSMDTPQDQAMQSRLQRPQRGQGDINDRLDHHHEEMGDHHPTLWEAQIEQLKNGTHDSLRNPNFKSALEKIGGLDVLTKLADETAGTGSSVEIPGNIAFLQDGEDPALLDRINKLTTPEKDALHEMMWNHYNNVSQATLDYINDNMDDNMDDNPAAAATDDSFDASNLPVHQINTYRKRPRKLGMKEVDKKQLLGEHPNDNAEKVQYMNLHKKLQEFLESLQKITK